VLARIGTGRPRPGGRILCYHSIGQAQFGVNDVNPKLFRQQLEFALANGYTFVDAEFIARGCGSARDLAVTFDDGCKSVHDVAAPILQDLGIPYKVFVVTDWSTTGGDGDYSGAFMTWLDLESLLREGARVGSHSCAHQDFGSLSPAQVRSDLEEARNLIRGRLGVEVNEFAIPFGLKSNWTQQASIEAREVGFELIYAQGELRKPESTIGRSFITNFDDVAVFAAVLDGRFDDWQEWT
jgi:peptidoglycan/xylan/chitin deacetylase (PgdA/CDA1 family)